MDTTKNNATATAVTTTTKKVSTKPKRRTVFDLNVVVVGEPATGKSAIVSRMTQKTFPSFYKPTNGVDYAMLTFELEEGVEAKVHFWDVSGHERFGSMTGSYYNQCAGVIFVFDCTRDLTLSALSHWNTDVNNKCHDGKDLPKILIANKCDMLTPSQDHHGLESDMASFCETCRTIGDFTCSAKTGAGHDEAIRALAQKMIENARKKGLSGRDQTPQRANLNKRPKAKQQQKPLGPPPLFQSWRF